MLSNAISLINPLLETVSFIVQSQPSIHDYPKLPSLVTLILVSIFIEDKRDFLILLINGKTAYIYHSLG